MTQKINKILIVFCFMLIEKYYHPYSNMEKFKDFVEL